MADELANILRAISTESLVTELMRRHFLEPVKKTKDQIAEEKRDFLLTNYPEAELHSKCNHPDWEYETFECPRKSSLGWEPEKEGWIFNEEYEGGHDRDDYLDYYHYRRLAKKLNKS